MGKLLVEFEKNVKIFILSLDPNTPIQEPEEQLDVPEDEIPLDPNDSTDFHDEQLPTPSVNPLDDIPLDPNDAPMHDIPVHNSSILSDGEFPLDDNQSPT